MHAAFLACVELKKGVAVEAGRLTHVVNYWIFSGKLVYGREIF